MTKLVYNIILLIKIFNLTLIRLYVLKMLFDSFIIIKSVFSNIYTNGTEEKKKKTNTFSLMLLDYYK